MQLRNFGKLDWKGSVLGFGAMRLPMNAGYGAVDENEAIRMIRYAVDHGVNYVDTAYPYHDGASEAVVGKALRDGYRDKVFLATKLPSWEVSSAGDFDRFLDLQLKRLGVDFLDCYLLHALNKGSWRKLRDLGVYKWAEKAIAGGRFRHLGFSFHDDKETFTKIVDDYDWPMCQVQYNFMDVDSQACMSGVKCAASKGTAVVVMEPLLGGRLVNPPAAVQAIWDRAARKRSAAGWALEWLWNQPEVSVVLSGMSTMKQVEEDVSLAHDSRVGSLSAADLALFAEARAAYKLLTVIPCTSCGYCKPCPQGVDIPGNIAVYNDGVMYDKPQASRGQYWWWKHSYEVVHILDHDVRAVKCIQCGDCEAKCPQGIPVSRWMPVIHSVLGEGKPFVKEL